MTSCRCSGDVHLLSALALILVFGAFVNAAGMIQPVMDWTGLYVFGLLIAPVIFAFLCAGLGRWLGRVSASSKELACTFALALVPLGFSMWIAHFSYHLVTGWSAIVPALRLGAAMAAGVPSWWPPAEILLLDCGLLLTLYVAWRLACQRTAGAVRALGLMMPWAALAILLYSAGVWILFQPMQMRGMVMN